RALIGDNNLRLIILVVIPANNLPASRRLAGGVILKVEAKLGRLLTFWGRTDGQWSIVLARTEADGADDFDARRIAADTYPARVGYGSVGYTVGPLPQFFVERLKVEVVVRGPVPK